MSEPDELMERKMIESFKQELEGVKKRSHEMVQNQSDLNAVDLADIKSLDEHWILFRGFISDLVDFFSEIPETEGYQLAPAQIQRLKVLQKSSETIVPAVNDDAKSGSIFHLHQFIISVLGAWRINLSLLASSPGTLNEYREDLSATKYIILGK